MGVPDETQFRPFGEIAAEIGHELNNQLGIVSGRAELARLYLDRGRVDDVRAGVEVILRQMDRMRLLSERLRGMRQPLRPLQTIDPRTVIREALEAHPIPGLDLSSTVLDTVPHARAHPETMHEVFAAIRSHLAANATAPGACIRTRIELRHEEGASAVGLTIEFEGIALDAARKLLGETTRILAPSGLGLRADFPESGALLQIDFPIAKIPAHS